MILRTLCDAMMALGRKIAITFIDYSAAFDSVSHRFIDVDLKKAKVSVKIRAMYRAVYPAASAYTTVPTADGKQVKFDTFAIRRGVVQGDITSPLYFILFSPGIDLAKFPGKGVPLGAVLVHTLGYADDAALIDLGDGDGIELASARVTSIDAGSKKDADMVISIKKTKVLHVREQEKTTTTSQVEAVKVCKFTCPHTHCNHKFTTKHGMLVHAGKCDHKDLFTLEKIVDHEGPAKSRKYRVRWAGHDAEGDTWKPRANIHPSEVSAYEKFKGVYDSICQHRCRHCNLPCKNE